MGVVEHNAQLSANLVAAQERAPKLLINADQLLLFSETPT